MSAALCRASASSTLFASFTDTTWAVTAEVVVASAPRIMLNIIGPDITTRLLLSKACSMLAEESWIERVLPFIDNSCQNRFHITSFDVPLDILRAPERIDRFFMEVLILSISNFRNLLY